MWRTYAFRGFVLLRAGHLRFDIFDAFLDPHVEVRILFRTLRVWSGYATGRKKRDDRRWI